MEKFLGLLFVCVVGLAILLLLARVGYCALHMFDAVADAPMICVIR